MKDQNHLVTVTVHSWVPHASEDGLARNAELELWWLKSNDILCQEVHRKMSPPAALLEMTVLTQRILRGLFWRTPVVSAIYAETAKGPGWCNQRLFWVVSGEGMLADDRRKTAVRIEDAPPGAQSIFRVAEQVNREICAWCYLAANYGEGKKCPT